MSENLEFEGGLPVVIDPAFRAQLDYIEDLQATLDARPFDDSGFIEHDNDEEYFDQIEKKLREPDNWPWMGRMVSVTGRLYSEEMEGEEIGGGSDIKVKVRQRTDGSPDTNYPYEVDVADVKMRSIGFRIVSDGRIIVDGKDVGARPVIKMLFQRDVPVEDIDYGKITEIVDYIADPKAIFMQGRPSDDAAAEEARYYFDEYFEDVENAFVGCRTPAEMLVTLGSITLPSPEYITKRQRKSLAAHLTEITRLLFETEPYLAEWRENAVFFSPGKRCSMPEAIEIDDQLIKIMKLEVQKAVDTEVSSPEHVVCTPRDGELEVRAVARLIGAKPDYDTGVISVPLKNFASLINIRQVHHGLPKH